LNQEIISQRAECYGQLDKLLNPLDQIYKDIKLQVQERDRKISNLDMTNRMNESAANFMQNEIFAFSKQSQILYEAYGDPTVISSALAMRSDGPKYVMIGTDQSVIIAIEIKFGRIDKVHNQLYRRCKPYSTLGSLSVVTEP
jgi:hypothetical protein